MADPPNDAFSHLFEPLRLGEVTLRNRVVAAPHGTNYAMAGLPTSRQIHYYATLAQGGCAMVVAGHWAVWPRTMASGLANNAVDPSARVGHVAIAEAVHSAGAVLVGQLHEGGRQSSSSNGRGPLLAPSASPDPVVREIPKELELDEIDELVRHFAEAAGELTGAGWDGVEILSAQGYGLAQFLSPQVNRRQDAYGGDLSARAGLLLRVVHAVRSAIGPSSLLGVRLNVSDFVSGGFSVDESIEVCKLLEQTQEVNYLSLSGASNENYPLWIADMGHSPELFLPEVRRIRQQTSLPVLTATRIKDPHRAEELLGAGDVDMVGMARALIADPALPMKARSGRTEEIRPCISCNQGCVGRVASGAPMGCTVNPLAGVDLPAPSQPTDARDVVVIGGGPAGLQAALAVAERGDRVRLFEAGDDFGGQIVAAAKVSSRSELRLIVDFLVDEALRRGVELNLNQAIDPVGLAELDCDALVLAVGSEPLRSGFSSARPSLTAIPGHDLSHVATAIDILQRPTPPTGTKVVVVDDDPHGQATTVAEYLASHDNDVTIVARGPTVGDWAGPANRHSLYGRLFRSGVRLLTSTWVDEIHRSGVVCSNVYSGGESSLACDSVVLATGNRVRDDLYIASQQFDGLPEVVRVGDCLAPRRLDEAISDGAMVGHKLTFSTR